MEDESLDIENVNSDSLLYDLTIRALSIVATVLFVILFFQGAEAAKKTNAFSETGKKEVRETATYSK